MRSKLFFAAKAFQLYLQLHQGGEEQRWEGLDPLQDGHQQVGVRHHLLPDEGERTGPGDRHAQGQKSQVHSQPQQEFHQTGKLVFLLAWLGIEPGIFCFSFYHILPPSHTGSLGNLKFAFLLSV